MESTQKKPLRESNIFDLSTDQELIAEVLDIPEITEAKYLKFASEQAIILDMVAFAEETNNASLLKELQQEFKDELARFFNE